MTTVDGGHASWTLPDRHWRAHWGAMESEVRMDEGNLFNNTQDDYAVPVSSHYPEQDRQEALHQVFQLLIGNVFGPAAELLEDTRENVNILDVGTGTGRWAVEIANTYQHAHVVGIDLVNPPVPACPDNCEWLIHDVVTGLPFADDSFDVVHVRDMTLGVRDFSQLFAECGRVLKPGGFLLAVEGDYDIQLENGESPDEALPWLSHLMFVQELAVVRTDDRQHCVNALRERGLDPYTSRYLEGQMHNTGWFDQIVADHVNAPLTPYHEDLILNQVGIHLHFAINLYPEGMKVILLDHGLTREDCIRLGVESLKELALTEERTVWPVYYVHGRKRTVDDE